MGCNIHAHLEVNVLGAWQYYREININRDYTVFAKLAGVRGPGPEPKGLPNNATLMTKLHLQVWSSDAHSTSWATQQEWMKTNLVKSHYSFYFFGNDLNLLKELEYYPPQIIDWRVIYWFDN